MNIVPTVQPVVPRFVKLLFVRKHHEMSPAHPKQSPMALNQNLSNADKAHSQIRIWQTHPNDRTCLVV